MDQRESTKVKGLAVLLLLFHHLFYPATRMEENQMVFYLLPEQVVQNAALAARVCVWMFAFLSAFGLTRKYMELASPRQAGEIGTFLRRRWISLMKPYWFVFVLLFLASFILFQNPLEVYQRNPVYIFLGFFALSDLFGTPTLCGIWWYMCFAQILLFFLPVCAELCHKFGWSTLILGYLSIQYLGEGIRSPYGGTYLGYLLVILLGVLCAQGQVFERIGQTVGRGWRRYLAGTGAVALAIGCLCAHLATDSGGQAKVFMTVAACLLSLSVYLLVIGQTASRILFCLGRYSGTIFLVHGFSYLHYPQLIYWSHNVPLTYLTLLAISLLLSIGIEKLQQLLRYPQWGRRRNKIA